MSDLAPSTLERMRQAHTVLGIPSSEPMVPWKSIRDLFSGQADRLETKPCLVFYSDDGHRNAFTYRELYELASRLCLFLLSAGLTPGDRIAIVSYNHSDVVVQYLAAWMAGLSCVPIDAGEDDRRIAFMLENSAAKMAIVRDGYVDRIMSLRDRFPKVRTIVQCGRKVAPDLPLLEAELLRVSSSSETLKPPGLNDEALMIYTSGTSGTPKAVLLDHYNLLVDAMAIAEWHQVAESETMMGVLPLHHVNGIVVTILTPLYGGSTIVLNQRFHPDRFFERLSAERVAIVSVVPTILQFLLHARLDMAAYKLVNFRHLICGAGPLTVELATRFEHTFKIPVIHGYGLSETTCYSCFLPIDLDPHEHRAWMSQHGFPSIGVPIASNEMAIHSPEGEELEEGQRGEIVVRGHNVMRRYFQNPEVNEETFRFGWFRTGDEGFFRFDEQGRRFFFITARLKELIIRGGVTISPFEIDEVLNHIPGIATGIAVGFENEWYGEEVGALVRIQPDMQVSEDRILETCRKQLPFAKAPKVVVFCEEIPVTSTGKLQRTLCKPFFEPWKSVQFTESQGGNNTREKDGRR